MPLREEKRVKLRTVVIGGLIVLVVAICFLWWRWDPLIDGICAKRGAVAGSASDVSGEGGGSAPSADDAGDWAPAVAHFASP